MASLQIKSEKNYYEIGKIRFYTNTFGNIGIRFFFNLKPCPDNRITGLYCISYGLRDLYELHSYLGHSV